MLAFYIFLETHRTFSLCQSYCSQFMSWEHLLWLLHFPPHSKEAVMFCVCVNAGYGTENGEGGESGFWLRRRNAGAESKRLKWRVGSCFSLYRRVIFKPTPPSLFLITALPLPLAQEAHLAKSPAVLKRTKRVIALRGSGTEDERFRNRKGGRERGGGSWHLFRVWHVNAMASSSPC